MEWQPIETAPFDVTILAYCRIYGRSVRIKKRIENTNYGEWDDPITGDWGGLPPTHWMPLPEPPKC